MRAFGAFVGAVACVAVLFASPVAAQADSVDPLVIKGQHFFYKTNGTEFFIRGVAYQQGVNSNGTIGTNTNYTDPLIDGDNCRRDIPYLVGLRTNTIRVYAVDPTQDHDDCMNQLAAAGIYVVSDLSQPNLSINRDDPAWNDALYQRYTAVIDMFSKYNNVIGFFAGNEVSNALNNTAASAYVKAAVRDSKAYIVQQNYRTMGVGYATYDGPIRDQLAQYFNCGPAEESIDFWGYNVYSWCGNSNYELSGYDARTEFFQDYSVPIFFAEYGCNVPEPRTFTEVESLYGENMTGVWSGGIVYMYFQEENNFGLVTVSGSSVSTLVDYSYLSVQMASVTPSATLASDYSPTFTATTCPSLDPVSWAATASPLPPTPNQNLCGCMLDTLSCTTQSDNATAYGDVFGFICGADPSACDGIVSNATTGDFGAYSVCDPKEQLAFVMNQYYLGQSPQNKASACDFSGIATLQSSRAPTGSCTSLLSVAGTNGGGTVPSPTGRPSATGAQQSASNTNAANSVKIPGFDSTLLVMLAYAFGAAVTGAGMIFL